MKVGCLQLTSKLNPNENLSKIRAFLEEAKSKGCKAVFLPEVFYSKGDGKSNPKYSVRFEDESFENICKLAKDYSLYLLGGSVVFDENGVIKNRVLNISPEGKLLNYYDKIHLFSCDVMRDGKQLKLDEGSLYTPGTELQTLDIEGMKLGLSVCFDIRFPQMYQEYVKQGVNVISISSAFTKPTGKAHWDTLVRARAIETQSYVIASCQWGKHNENMESYGHSVIIDPWGEVLQLAESGEALLVADLDFNFVNEARRRVIVHPELI